MVEPFSIAAGTAGLISFGIKITESLVQFYASYKSRDSKATRTIEKLGSLSATFQILQDALQSRTFQPDERSLVDNIETTVHKCDELIQELQEELEKLSKHSASDLKETFQVAGRRAAYPFRESTLNKLDEAISEIRHNLSLALNVLQLRDHESVQDDIYEIKSLLETIKTNQISTTIRDWLKAPDVTSDHNAACVKRYPGTGVWFVTGSSFKTWLNQERSFLWCSGFAGCGKTVLCSTAIQYAFRHKRSDPGMGIAFFYFTFNDESKQDDSAMLRALILQLSAQRADCHAELTRFHDSHNSGTPPPQLLLTQLRSLIQRFDQVYILLDALDESPRHRQQNRVLDAIKTMREWRLLGLHLLLTSRDEPLIRQSIDPTKTEDFVMKSDGIDQDICNFISGQLKVDLGLQKWRGYHNQIQQTLSQRAQGV